MYVTGVTLFAAASAWCGLAPDVSQLVFARGVQGIGAALLVPGSLAIISASFSERDRGRAIGTWSGFTAITTALGPVLGGWLIEQASWRWVFFINIPLALIVLVLTFMHVPESRNPKAAAGRLDWLGAGLATIGLGGVTFSLIESSTRGWGDSVVTGTIVVGLLAFGSFVVVETRSRTPLLPHGLFRSRNFSGANLLTLLLYSGLSGSLFFFPLNLIQVQGYSATAAGAATLPFVLLIFLLSRWSGGLVERYGPRLPLVIGPIIAATGFAMFALPSVGGSYWTTFFPAVVVLGLGMAVSVAPLTTTVMNAVRDELAGIASGVNNAVSRVAAVLAIALFGMAMLSTFNMQLDLRLGENGVSPALRGQLLDQRINLAAMEIPLYLDANASATIQRSIKESFVAGFRIVMLLASVLALTSAASAWWMIGDKPKAHDPGVS